ncbi:tetratricopeptide repeat protein [Actibacterium sp.]|uniref:O-linked N-acetylglucosamine transferase, SPINDLY family protein n=1 Tax=Actibacterium sp. TaxID=1872125 RepID=UPI00356589E7
MTVDETLAYARDCAAAGNIAEARRMYELILNQFPNSTAAKQGLASLGVAIPEQRAALAKVLEDLDKKIQTGLAAPQIVQIRELAKQFWLEPGVQYALCHAEAYSGDAAASLTAIEAACRLSPETGRYHKARADLLRTHHRIEDAIAAYHRALELLPEDMGLLNNLGVTYIATRNYAEAIPCFERMLAINPASAPALNNLAVVAHDSARFEDCIGYAERALAADPGYVAALNNLGNARMALSRFDEAAEAYDRALVHEPGNFEIRSKLMLCLARICDWQALAPHREIVERELKGGSQPRALPNPWAWLGIFDDSEIHHIVSVGNARGLRHRPDLGPIPARPRRDKIKVGYFSADFHNHPTTHLISGLFEQHDRSRFEISAYSFGPDRDPDIRDRVRKGVDAFHDVRTLSDIQIARLAREHGIDIAIDVNGHTANKRTGVFTYRAAPVQVNYLGFPSTMGMEDMDYVLADATVIPDENKRFFTEKVAWMPGCYQVNDNRKVVSNPGPSRQDCDLPEGAFVFCCFNSSYKITGEVFDIWMRLMRQVENSVLWLFRSNDLVDVRLRQHAEARGVSGDRLIFARRVSQADHLARHRHADLFLDTLPYNAHTTASDALWMGLPLVTLQGQTFAGRVAASALKAVGLPELITTTPADYEALALQLATDADTRAAYAARLIANRDTASLFDTARFARDAEALFTQMHERVLSGLPPAHLSL